MQRAGGLLLLILLLVSGCTKSAAVQPGHAAQPSTPASDSPPPTATPPASSPTLGPPPSSTASPHANIDWPTVVGAKTHIYAVDPTGTTPPTILFSSPTPLIACAMSPDGHYLLLRTFGLDKYQYTFTPVLVDLTTGAAKQRAPLEMAYCDWSGAGFWVDSLVHLDLNLKVETYPALRKALGLDGQGQQLLAASWSADGSRVARSVQPWWANRFIGGLALSPDGTRLVITGNSPVAALVFTDRPARNQWQPLGGSPLGGPRVPAAAAPPDRPRWSRDGKQIYVPLVGVLDRAGQALSADAPVNLAEFQDHWQGTLGSLPDGRQIILR